jgi:hypothetical protein
VLRSLVTIIVVVAVGVACSTNGANKASDGGDDACGQCPGGNLYFEGLSCCAEGLTCVDEGTGCNNVAECMGGVFVMVGQVGSCSSGSSGGFTPLIDASRYFGPDDGTADVAVEGPIDAVSDAPADVASDAVTDAAIE